MSLSIKHITSDSGDWHVVLINGSVDYEGHSIPPHYWVDLLKSFGFNVESRQITDKQMEEGNYYDD